MPNSTLNSAVTKIEAANLTDDEIGSLAEAIALTLTNNDGGDVEGFVDSSSPKLEQGFSLNFEEIKVTLHNQLQSPRDSWIPVLNYIDASSVT